jgi:hypothetical protein
MRHLKNGFKQIKLHPFIRTYKAKISNLGDHKHASSKCKVVIQLPKLYKPINQFMFTIYFSTNEINNLLLTKKRKHSESQKCHTLWQPQLNILIQVVDISTEVDRAFDSSPLLLLLSIPSLNTTHMKEWRMPVPDCQSLIQWICSPLIWISKNHNSIGAQSSQGYAHRRKAPN